MIVNVLVFRFAPEMRRKKVVVVAWYLRTVEILPRSSLLAESIVIKIEPMLLACMTMYKICRYESGDDE